MFDLYFVNANDPTDKMIVRSYETFNAAQDDAIIKHDAYHKYPPSASAKKGYYAVLKDGTGVFSTQEKTGADELIAKWRTIQRLLEELSNEDADAAHMHNTARFDVFFHGIAWAKDMADYHERQKDYTPEQRAMFRRISDEQRAGQR